jgi:hypothetical protein
LYKQLSAKRELQGEKAASSIDLLMVSVLTGSCSISLCMGTSVAYGGIEGYNVHAYSHMDSISYTIPA